MSDTTRYSRVFLDYLNTIIAAGTDENNPINDRTVFYSTITIAIQCMLAAQDHQIALLEQIINESPNRVEPGPFSAEYLGKPCFKEPKIKPDGTLKED